MKEKNVLTAAGNEIINLMKKGAYAKGWGSRHIRLMTRNHNPIANFPRSDFNFLIREEIVVQKGLCYYINLSADEIIKEK